jgi:hypothetical protein
LTTEKIAAFAPMPSASVRMMTALNPGFARNMRSANRRSLLTACTGGILADDTSSMSPARRRITSSWPTPCARSVSYSSSRCWRISSLIRRGHSGTIDSFQVAIQNARRWNRGDREARRETFFSAIFAISAVSSYSALSVIIGSTRVARRPGR